MSHFAHVFDAYGTLLDIHSAVSRNSASVGDVAVAFSTLWRQRQLEYTWTRSLMNQYADFWEITREALEYALESFQLDGNADFERIPVEFLFGVDRVSRGCGYSAENQVSGHDYRGS